MCREEVQQVAIQNRIGTNIPYLCQSVHFLVISNVLSEFFLQPTALDSPQKDLFIDTKFDQNP